MRRLWIVALLLACGKDLSQLELFPCARDATCPGNYVCVTGLCRPWLTCEPVASQNACPATAPRCTLVPSPTGGYTTLCVAGNGSSLHADDVCSGGQTLTSSLDECPTGTVCYNESTAGGAAEPNNHCRAFCSVDGDCGASARCVFAFPGPQFGSLALGVCEPVCAAFSACAELGHHCDAIPDIAAASGVLTCRANGTVGEGANCATANCQPGLLCIPGIAPFQTAPTCRVTCDASHLCASGSCQVTTAFDMGNGVGFCH